MSRSLADLDDALIRLRRLWSVSRSRVVDDGAGTVEMSHLLVVEACARGAESGLEVTVGTAARLVDVVPSTASRLIDSAERAGLVARTPSAVDARRTVVLLTPAGAALRRRAVDARTAWLDDRLADWDPEDVARFSALLSRFADAVHDSPEPGVPGPPAPGGP